jgi:uncharacterized protein (TIGR00730 family)
LKRMCVFCGSSPGSRPEYIQVARDLGRLLVQQQIELVYGGARMGMMGAIASTVLQDGGKVVGVIPKGLAEKEVAFTTITDLRVVDSMHERKALMAELSDAFIALPGGLGTIEELFEILTWGQLGLHRKPCGLLNTGGYFRYLLSFLDHAVSQQFIEPEHRSMVMVADRPEALLDQFRRYQPPTVDKAKWALRLAEEGS